MGQSNAGLALRFDGVDDYVSIPHSPAHNAYPITITAWVKTLRNTNLYEGIVSKYFPGSLDGWSVFLNNGRLRAFYFRNSGNYVWNPLGDGLGLDGGAIDDGQWHHILFEVAPAGAVLYVDGNFRQFMAWTGSPGWPTTNSVPILIGRYSEIAPYTNSFAGEIDEVTLWNRDLSVNELNYLKHRRLTGREDGLLGYWRFNEGSGTSVADGAPNNFTGTLRNGPAWVASYAAIALHPVATNCLKFDGASGYVQVAHNVSLNAYPFTATAWFRTTNTAPGIQGIVSKYRDGSGNGWFLIVQNSRLRGYYSQSLSNPGMDVTSPASVADGGWHHAAMMVDGSGGKLLLDGVLIGTSSWALTGGGPSEAEPLQLGRYNNIAQRFQGALDEVTVWNRALTVNEVQTVRNLPLSGSEAGLVGYWRLDEGTGATTADATGHGYTGSLIGSPTWVGSTAYLGDGSVHLVASPGTPTFVRQYAINTAPGKGSFEINALGFVRRFFDFGPTPSSITVSTRLRGDLKVAGSSTLFSVRPNAILNNFSMGAYNASSSQPVVAGAVASLSSAVSVTPDSGVQVDSVNNLHEIVVTLSHSENGGAFTDDGTDTTGPGRLLHFNGRLLFGDVEATITDTANIPQVNALFPPAYLQTQLQLPIGGGQIAGQPGFTFGGGSAFNVHLGRDGTATNVDGTFSINPTSSLEASGIRYFAGPITLSSSGATAGDLILYFPTGFGYRLRSADTRIFKGHFEGFGRTAKLNATLKPVSNIVFSAAQLGEAGFYFSEETKPFWIAAPQLEWRVAQGELYIAEATSLYYTRQAEDDEVAAARPNLVNALAADRISNDGYYRNISRAAGEPIYIRPDTNGAALLSMRAALQPTEFRPHYPYMNRNVGGYIPEQGGSLVVADDLVNVNASQLVVFGPVPLPYGRDCGPESLCAGFPTVAQQVLNFNPQSSVLNFTPDGGFIAYGWVPPTNLTWGYLGGTNYAQRTSNVETGAYHIPGTFLRGDQTTVEDAQRPAVLLLTGRGYETNSPYVERPNTPSYADGFANYAGLNFRKPAEGRSFIAGQDTLPYALTARAKYYVRYSGVSGIHEAVDFVRNLNLYAYPFRFLSYRLSYLDSDNWESRTDGSLRLPYPSDFPMEFERMKFLCRGSLESAQLPASAGVKRMAYWHTDIQPMSIQFKPPVTNSCSLSNRFLVLGVQTKLPLIAQAFQAALGFKPDGNLVTAADGVSGVNSRFPVPANLELQGPIGTNYVITTAAEGYFNNWEPNAPIAGQGGDESLQGAPLLRPEGFYNIVALMRVPFFRGIKVQLHVTPVATNQAQLDLMGGWPAEEGIAPNHGWRSGSSDYFNNSKFDLSHRGWPGGISPDGYRTSSTEQYRPRAQRDWLELVKFDYPLVWNAALRNFAAFTDVPVSLPIMNVNSRLKELSPSKIDLDFSQDLQVQLPRIKVLDLANKAISGANDAVSSVSNIVHQELSEVLQLGGFNKLQDALREEAEPFFRTIVEPFLDITAAELYRTLSNAVIQSGKVAMLANTVGFVANSGLRTNMMLINGAADDVNGVIDDLHQTLTDVDQTLGLFIRILERTVENGETNRHIIRVLIRKLVEDQGDLLGFSADFSDRFLNSLLTDVDPTLDKIEAELRKVRQEVKELSDALVATSSDFKAALEAANHDANALQDYLTQAGVAVSNLLYAVVDPFGDYFRSDPERAKREIRERLLVAFFGSPVLGNYQETIRQYLYDKNFLINQLLATLFDQVNRCIRNGLTSQMQVALDNRFLNLKGSGALSTSMLAAKVRGSPIFQGDSLRLIHLDADMKMRLPDDMDFGAYMEIKELNSESTPVSCLPGGTSATEIILGAKDAPMDWAGVRSDEQGAERLVADLEARWTLQGGDVRGVGGSFTFKGKAGFKGVNIHDVSALLAIGATENYFAGKAGATAQIPITPPPLVVTIPVEFRAGVFAGHACTNAPLKFVDSEFDKVLQNPNDFSGVYVEFGGSLSLSEILLKKLHVPRQGETAPPLRDCMLDIKADTTTAVYYQDGPRFGRIGGRQKIGVNAELFCVLQGSAHWGAFAELDTAGQLTFGGLVEVCGKVGICPVCVKGCQPVRLKAVLNDDGLLDYFVDY